MLPRPNEPAEAFHLFVFDADLWSRVLREYFVKHEYFTNNFRVDKQPFENLGIGLLSFDGRAVTGVSLVHWSKPASMGKRKAKFIRFSEMPSAPMTELGLPSEEIAKYACASTDACDAGSRGIPSEPWHQIQQALSGRSDMWQSKITELLRLRDEMRRELEQGAARLIAQEKDAVLLLARAWNIDPEFLPPWAPTAAEAQKSSFLRPAVWTHEFRMVEMDMVRLGEHFPGALNRPIHGGISLSHKNTRISIMNVSSDRIEHALGVDLYYYNHDFDSYVLLQYKAMEQDSRGRYTYKPKGQHELEAQRMISFIADLPKESAYFHAGCVKEHRLGPHVFFFKLCPRFVYTAFSSALLPGLYIPLDVCQATVAAQNVIDQNARHLNNSTFVTLLKDGWIGSRGRSSDAVRRRMLEIIQGTVDAGRAPVLAAALPDPGGENAQRITSFGTDAFEIEEEEDVFGGDQKNMRHRRRRRR
jgi:hypothetical protein